ncbi:XkdQ/YqbQ family protein [Ureibacillus thermophilus]|uniref:Hydrolase n=1 Tax=Ureibacillus thermophilus TaxID=367743 RepID=A0A4P6UTS3_9BACL|nr:hydrolase [Ureibacillus thermophilus]QBK26749.1 hydrolase [Ureibacillus thermophilus]
MANVELIIQNGNKIQQCVVEEGVTWETQRRKAAGKLTFTVLKDEALGFQEGNPVIFKYNGNKIFYGFVFTKERQNNDKIKVTAYDQLRYLKNKDTYVFTNKSAVQILKTIAADFNLNFVSADDTKYYIPTLTADNKELFEIIQMALDETTANTGEVFVLYDEFGKLILNNMKDMRLNILIDEETGESFNYTTSIDNETYNKIKLVYEDKKNGKREIYIAQDTNNINKWGVLQYFETIQESANGKLKADTLLKQFNRKSRKLSVNKVFGDVRVRGGSVLPVALYLGDITVANYMVVESVKHTFNESSHTMDLQLIGGEFIA